MEKLTTQRLQESILIGAQIVIDHKEELNRINVFPVADGDTGSNLAALMEGIIDNSLTKVGSLEEALVSLADAALISARGNSGTIFAQYFNSVAALFQQGQGDVPGLLNALKAAVSETYEALTDPQEGTILSVMTVWALTLTQSFEAEHSLSKALLSAEKMAKEALDATQFQMALLKKNQLVDAGAKGFYYFISGLTTYLLDLPQQQQVSVPQPIEEKIAINHDDHQDTVAPTFRFCSEFIVKNLVTSKDALRRAIASQGDSLIVAGNDRQVKVHIHTDKPQAVLELLLNEGEVTYQKVDDMGKQYAVTKNRRQPIAIVTDSVADLSESFINDNQIHVLPMNILGDKQNYLDKLTIDSEKMAELLGYHQVMSTAQPNVATVDGLLSFLQEKYDHVLVITVSQKLSGTYQLIKQRIKERQLSDQWIQVIDSRLNTVAQGLLIKAATALIEQKRPFEKVVSDVEKIREKIFIYVAVSDLSPMIASGRIPKAVGKVARLLSLHPIVSLDSEGNGRLSGMTFTQKQSVKKINKKIKKLLRKNQLNQMTMTHIGAFDETKEWQGQLASYLPYKPDIVDCSAVIAVSAGLGCMAVAGILNEEDVSCME